MTGNPVPDPSGVRLTPAQVGQLRARMLHVVEQGIDGLLKVVRGEEAWSQTRLQAFRLACAKVLPDLSASYVEVNDLRKPVGTMSRAELEAALAATEPVAIPAREPGTPAFLPAPAPVVSETVS